MLKLNKKNKNLKLLNPKAFLAILSASAILLSGCNGKKNNDVSKEESSTTSSDVLLSDEQNTPEVVKYTEIDKTSWVTFKNSVYDVSESKFNNDISIENLETALMILNIEK